MLMPRMNGLEVLEQLRKITPCPKILMLSSLTSKGAEMTIEAIRRGADDFMLKPKDIPHLSEIGKELVAKIKHMVTLPVLSAPRSPKEIPLTRPAER